MRWIRRGAAVLLVGVAGTLASASPASAADNRVHTLSVGGTARIVDFDNPDNDDICTRSTNMSTTLQFPVTQSRVLSWNPRCDEVRINMRFEANIDSNGNMNVRVVAELHEEDCTVWVCSWSRVTTRSWSGVIGTGGTGTIEGANGFVDGGGDGNAQLNLAISNTSP